MAYTASTGFRFVRDLRGNTASPTPLRIRIANSTTLRVGDLVRVNTSGLVVTAGAGALIAGVLVGFVDQDGINPFSLGYSGAGATLTGDDTLATASDNATRAQFIMAEVIIDVSGEYLWRNDTDGGTTLAQTHLFMYFDVDSTSRQVVTGSGSSDAAAQVQLMAIDPEGSTMEPNNPASADATIALFRIAENQFGMLADAATAKNAA